jgi:UDP-N-acetylmuramoyl-tripeptide--D-alanyl-D-alanine ligase
MIIQDLYTIYQRFPSIQTDTRKLKAGDLFFALKGGNFNGNQFAQQAIDLGAAYCVVDEAVTTNNPDKILRVDDALKTLQDLAGYHRGQFSIPFIAITGSNGKTTSKELIHAVLSSSFITYTTEGNLNNHIGIPLTILKIKADAQLAVIEMGANHLKEIAGYCLYTQPTHGLITNSGKAHLEGFGSVEGVRKGKGELFDYLRAHNGTAFIMWDYDYLRDMSRGIPRILTYGTHDAQLTGTLEKSPSFLKVKITGGSELKEISTQLVGDYNLPNVLAAVSIGHYFKVPAAKIKSSIERYTPSNSRSQLIEQDTNKIIMDAYNANPSSMKAAIENFAHLPGTKKILILGAMAELGKDSMQEHQFIVDLINHYTWKEVVLVGGDFVKLNPPFRIFENSLQAKEWYQLQSFQDSNILIKGSRSMQMEKLLEGAAAQG